MSQSQSSTSSTSSVVQDQKNVQGFKEKIKEEHKPFFVRYFIRLGILIFLLVLGLSILDYVLIYMFINFLDTSYTNSDMIYKQNNDLLKIPTSFRTIYQIYQGDELNESDIYEDRIKAYLEIISNDLESLRELTNSIDRMKHSYTNEHKHILDTALIEFVEKPDKSSVSNVYYYNNYTLGLAIANYIAKGTQIKQFSYEFIKAGKGSANETSDYNFDRLMSFMIDNGMNTLKYYAGKSEKLFFEEVISETNSKNKVITIILIISPISIALLMMLFVPFILKVQSSLLKIYFHLCQFKDGEIAGWLEACNSSASDIKASIKQMYKIYSSVNFDSKLNNSSNQEPEKPVVTASLIVKASDEDNKTKETNIYNDKKPTDKDNPDKTKNTDEETEQFIISKDEAVSEHKQRMFSKMTRKKTAAYLIYLLFFLIYIGIFRLADGLVFSNIYKKTDLLVYLYQIMTSRSHYGLLSAFFLREELKRAEVLTDFEYGNATNYYVTEAFEAEMLISRVRAKLTGELTELNEFLNIIDSFNYCYGMFTESEDIDECSKVYSGLLPMGFNNVIINGLGYVKKTDAVFMALPPEEIADFTAEQLKYFEIVKSNDLRLKYSELTFNRAFEILREILNDWISKQMMIHRLKFAIYVIFLVIIFILLWNKMVSNMQMDIIKALGILNVLPTSHLGKNLDFIRDMNRSSLIN